MIEGISGISSVNENIPNDSTPALGQDEFLKMFLAQLQHQDPLNPMDSTEFSAQLAQFSSLEQLFNVNHNLESLTSLQNQASQFQALDFIGKEVSAAGNIINLKQDSTPLGEFTLGSTSDCTLLIIDQDGYPVRTISLGVLAQGENTFEWDGYDDAGNMMDEGIYGFEITAIAEDGSFVPVETRITGQVTRINMEGAEPVLYIGDIPISISQVLEIRVPDSTEGGAEQDGEGDSES